MFSHGCSTKSFEKELLQNCEDSDGSVAVKTQALRKRVRSSWQTKLEHEVHEPVA